MVALVGGRCVRVGGGRQQLASEKLAATSSQFSNFNWNNELLAATSSHFSNFNWNNELIYMKAVMDVDRRQVIFNATNVTFPLEVGSCSNGAASYLSMLQSPQGL